MIGVVYYTDNNCPERITMLGRQLILKADIDEIISVSHYPIDFGKNIVVDLPRCSTSIFKQILMGLEASTADIIYLCEHDVLYHSSHFETIPGEDAFYYDKNRYALNILGQAQFRYSMSPSFLCAKREVLLRHYTEFNKVIKKRFSRKNHGFAPGGRKIDGMVSFPVKTYLAAYPSIDLRLGTNFTMTHDFKEGIGITATIPHWGKIDNFDEFLKSIYNEI